MMRILIGPVLVASLATACVGGAQVFDPEGDAGPPAPCVRATPELRSEGGVWIESDVAEEDRVVIGALCLPRQLARAEDQTIDCELGVLLGSRGRVTACSELAGLVAAGTRTLPGGETLVACDVVHRTSDSGVGWRYVPIADVEPGSEVAVQCLGAGLPDEPERTTGVLDVSGVELAFDASMTWSCAVAVAEAANTLGAPCAPLGSDSYCGLVDATARHGDTIQLMCDPVTSQCNVPCERDTDCTDAGLEGDRCGSHGFCVPATCG